MTRSSNHPDADYTPNDMGAPEQSNPAKMWETYEDGLIDEIRYAETL